MILSRSTRSVILGAVLTAGAGPAIAQFQELPVEMGVSAEAEYSWSVRVADEGIVLAGDVPYLSVKQGLMSRAGDDAIDGMAVAEGAPLGFLIDATKAVEASALFSDGGATYSNGAWTISGTLGPDADRAALDEVLGERTMAGEPWLIELEDGIDESVITQADADEPTELELAPPAQPNGADESVAGAEAEIEISKSAEIPQENPAETVDDIAAATAQQAAAELADQADGATDGAEEQEAQDERATASVEDAAAAPADEVLREQDAAEPARSTESDQAPTTEPEPAPVAIPMPTTESENDPAAVSKPIPPVEPDPDYAFSVQTTEDGLVFSGQVPDASTRLLAGNVASGLDGLANLVIAEGAPDDFTKTAFSGIAALEHLETGSVSLADGQWRIEGEAALEADRRAAVETLDRLSRADIWTVAITAPAPIDTCRERIESYMADRSILFGSGSARLTEGSKTDLAGLAEIFAICPSAPVYVEGHTDTDGGPEDNLILSLSRAEAVIDALMELGIDPGRLYAVGYGAGLPIASNETAAGKAQNRRIVFSFEDIAGTGEGDEP